jgi:hypothetical protein
MCRYACAALPRRRIAIDTGEGIALDEGQTGDNMHRGENTTALRSCRPLRDVVRHVRDARCSDRRGFVAAAQVGRQREECSKESSRFHTCGEVPADRLSD